MLPVTQEPSVQDWPPSGWLTKQTSSSRISLSESRVFALAEAGKIKTQRVKSPTSGQWVTLFHEGDIERFIFERKNPEKVSKVPATLTGRRLAGSMPLFESIPVAERGEIQPKHSTEHYAVRWWTRPGPDRPYFHFFIEGPGARGVVFEATAEECGPQMIRGLESAFQFGAREGVYKLHVWLTVAEASEYSGLPASVLDRLIKAGRIRAMDCLNSIPRDAGRYRIKRSDLDALEGA